MSLVEKLVPTAPGYALAQSVMRASPKSHCSFRRPCPHNPQADPLFCCRWDLPFVESAFNHCVCFANQNVGRDLVLGAAKFAKTRQKNEIIESFFWQGQTQ